jgi:serine/threonine protein phosphatase PrpC
MRVGQVAGASDPGRKRRRNEDSYVIDPPLFAVADGMGGAQAGEIASKLAASAVRSGDPGQLEELIQEANRRVHQRSVEDSAASGMGTTLTVAEIVGERVSIGHVGDSRAYLVRDGSLEQLTQDHSLVAELVRSGKLTPEEAEQHPQRSVITRALGTDPDVDVDTFAVEPRTGDLFLLCSDGLTSMVDDRMIERLVEEKRGDLEGLVKALIRAANKGGGEDNITVVAFEIAEGDLDAIDDTRTMHAVDGDAAEFDEDDTLTEADRVPAIDTMVVSVEDIAAAYDKTDEQTAKPKRRRRLSRVLALIVVLLALVAITLALVWGLMR